MLINPITKNRLERFLEDPAHAVALTAPDGAGKGYLAQHLAAQLLHVDSTDNHPYVLNIDARTNKTGIDEVRAIQKFLTLTIPGNHTIKRVVMIESADLLGHEAQNALLKTLEEPPKNTVIIITYANEQLILQTIRSRITVLPILPISLEQAHAEMSQEPSVISRAYHISSGYVGLLWVLLNGDVEHPLVTAISEARQLLGMSRYQRMAHVDQIAKSKTTEPKVLLDGLYRLLSAGYHQSVQSKSANELKPMMQRLQLIEQALRDLHDNVQTKLVLSRLFFEL